MLIVKHFLTTIVNHPLLYVVCRFFFFFWNYTTRWNWEHRPISGVRSCIISESYMPKRVKKTAHCLHRNILYTRVCKSTFYHFVIFYKRTCAWVRSWHCVDDRNDSAVESIINIRMFAKYKLASTLPAVETYVSL